MKQVAIKPLVLFAALAVSSAANAATYDYTEHYDYIRKPALADWQIDGQMQADAVPRQLYNKTIRVNWAQSMVMKLLAEGRQISATPRFERAIYISSAGRLFVRSHAVGQGRTTPTRTVEHGPEQSGSTTTFQNGTIVNFAQRPGTGVATRLTISFDASFSSCTASVSVGKLGPNPKLTGIDGSPRELIDVSASTPSCAISEGNGVAQ